MSFEETELSVYELDSFIEEAEIEAAAQLKVLEDIQMEVDFCGNRALKRLKMKALKTAELKASLKADEAISLREEKERLVEEQRRALEALEEAQNPGLTAAKRRAKSREEAKQKGGVVPAILDMIDIEDFTCSVRKCS